MLLGPNLDAGRLGEVLEGVRQAQGLASRPHALRPMRPYFHVSNLHRRNRYLLDQSMSPEPRSRVSFFMNKFRKLGFIDYNGGIEVHSSLLNMVLHEEPKIET